MVVRDGRSAAVGFRLRWETSASLTSARCWMSSRGPPTTRRCSSAHRAAGRRVRASAALRPAERSVMADAMLRHAATLIIFIVTRHGERFATSAVRRAAPNDCGSALGREHSGCGLEASAFSIISVSCVSCASAPHAILNSGRSIESTPPRAGKWNLDDGSRRRRPARQR